MEQEGDLDVLPMFEKAVGVVLEVRHPLDLTFTTYCPEEICMVF